MNSIYHHHPNHHLSPAGASGSKPHGASDPAEHTLHGSTRTVSVRLVTAVTLHCLVGCSIGEGIGLMLGSALALAAWPTMLLATLLGFVSGYGFGLWPLVRRGQTWLQAWRAIWLGETVSIAVMELAMNFTDYHLGGIGAAVIEPRFWLGYGAAIAAGFVVAWPLNAWLLRRHIKRHCH